MPAAEHIERQITVVVVIAVEETLFLMPLRPATPGLMTSREQLHQLGLVAAPDTVPAARRVPLSGQGSRGWPDYQQCLDGAPQNSDGSGRDRSRADFLWCKGAIERAKGGGWRTINNGDSPCREPPGSGSSGAPRPRVMCA